MRNNYSNFNQLAVFGKVAGKPEFFDELMSFPVFQEGTNLFMNVLCAEDRSIKLGFTLDLRGKLMFDTEEESLFLHATEVFVVSTGARIKDSVTETISDHKVNTQNMESSVRKEANLPNSTEVPQTLHSEQHSVGNNAPTQQSQKPAPHNVGPVFETPSDVVHLPNSTPTDTGFKLFKVSQPTVPTLPVETAPQQLNQQMPPVQQSVPTPAPVETALPQFQQQQVIQQASVQQPAQQSTKPVVHVNHNQVVNNPPVEKVPDNVISVAQQGSSATKEVKEEPENKEFTGYSLNDFDC